MPENIRSIFLYTRILVNDVTIISQVANNPGVAFLKASLTDSKTFGSHSDRLGTNNIV